MLHYQNVNEVSEATGDQTSEIPLTENHHGNGKYFMLTVRLPVLGLHGKKMPNFIYYACTTPRKTKYTSENTPNSKRKKLGDDLKGNYSCENNCILRNF